MPAQSPTLSPTLSAMVAALRGSSSGMPASTLPTRSAPTSAALVKMPPPTLMKSASSEAPKAKPMRTAVAEFWKMSTMAVAPTRPSPTQSMPVTAPVRKATRKAPAMPPPLCRRRRRADVAPHGDAHADEAGQAGEGRTEEEADHAVEPVLGEGEGDGAVGAHDLGGGEEDEDGQGHDDDGDGAELALEERLRPPPGRPGRSPASLGVPVSAASTLRASRRPAPMPTTPAARQMYSQALSFPPRWKAWYPPLPAARRLIIPGVPFLLRSVYFRRGVVRRAVCATGGRRLSQPGKVVDLVLPGRRRAPSCAPDDGPGGTLATVGWREQASP